MVVECRVGNKHVNEYSNALFLYRSMTPYTHSISIYSSKSNQQMPRQEDLSTIKASANGHRLANHLTLPR